MHVRQYRIFKFNHRHDVSEDEQFSRLVSEMGDLADAYSTGASDEVVAEELANLIFTARSLAELRDIDVSEVVNDTVEDALDCDSEGDVDAPYDLLDATVDADLEDGGLDTRVDVCGGAGADVRVVDCHSMDADESVDTSDGFTIDTEDEAIPERLEQLARDVDDEYATVNLHRALDHVTDE